MCLTSQHGNCVIELQSSTISSVKHCQGDISQPVSRQQVELTFLLRLLVIRKRVNSQRFGSTQESIVRLLLKL